MSFLSRILGRTGGDKAESARTRATGGEPEADAADQHSTTGTTPNDTFVGRVSGDDPGYLETGAEQRAEEDGGSPDTQRPH